MNTIFGDIRSRRRIAASLCAVLLAAGRLHAETDPLPSWNDGRAKQSILSFVREVTDVSGARYVAPADRIATFDQDGTLWVEQPLYPQAMFALDRVRRLAPQHPAWKAQEPFKAVIAGDREAMAKFAESDWVAVIDAACAGMSTEEFIEIVRDWAAKARHPRFNRRYTELVYQPMLEAMRYLRANGFRTYIVTGGGQEMTRAYAESVYGIPPEQVVGSSILTRYEYRDGRPVLMREPKLFFHDDFAGKAIGINLFIGKRPHAAFGR